MQVAFSALKQAIAEEVAKSWSLEITYDQDKRYVDMGVSGNMERVAGFINELADEYGIGKLVINMNSEDKKEYAEYLKVLGTAPFNMVGIID